MAQRYAGNEIAVDFCRRFPNTPNHALARTVYEQHKAVFKSLEVCRSAIRYARGNCGKQHRKDAKGNGVQRENGAGFAWKFPMSRAEKWQPFPIEAKRTLVMSDLHIPFHDRAAIEAVVKAGEKFEPDCILLNGDICDFYSASRFDKNPTVSSIKDEIKLTRQFLGWIRGKFPKARVIYKFGNHDEWFDKYIWRKAPELLGIESIRLDHLFTEKLSNEPEITGVEFLMDQEKIQIGALDVYHGHEFGKGSIAPPVNPARGFFLKTYECTLA